MFADDKTGSIAGTTALPRLPPDVAAAMRAGLPDVGERVVAAVIAEVPAYTDAFSGAMGRTIRGAVEVALGGFLSLAGQAPDPDHPDHADHPAGPGTPTAPAVEGSYQLGRGEARSGRSTDALLSAFRIGARVSWRDLSSTAVAHGVDGAVLADFAELVFAYIDELSAAAVAGHTDEMETTGAVRQRMLERVARHLLAGDPAEVTLDAAERAGWVPPTTLTAVLVPAAQSRPLVRAVSPATLVTEPPGGGGADAGSGQVSLLLVPDAHGPARAVLMRQARGRGALVGPAKAWLEARASYDRALRAQHLGLAGDGTGAAASAGDPVDTEAHLPLLVLGADPDALADLRAQALAPLADLKPATADKLVETLRSWLLHLGRRDDVAGELFVHPQTVRYRMGQLRELYGDRLDDPEVVLALVVALGSRPPG